MFRFTHRSPAGSESWEYQNETRLEIETVAISRANYDQPDSGSLSALTSVVPESWLGGLGLRGARAGSELLLVCSRNVAFVLPSGVASKVEAAVREKRGSRESFSRAFVGSL